MMMPAWRIAYGAVSGVECPVRQMALLFAEKQRRDWIGRDS
jgi:hypothetical protein